MYHHHHHPGNPNHPFPTQMTLKPWCVGDCSKMELANKPFIVPDPVCWTFYTTIPWRHPTCHKTNHKNNNIPFVCTAIGFGDTCSIIITWPGIPIIIIIIHNNNKMATCTTTTTTTRIQRLPHCPTVTIVPSCPWSCTTAWRATISSNI